MQIIALIPAAGKGERFGMPKVDAMFNGISFSEKIIAALQEAGITQYMVIRDVDTPDMLASLKVGMDSFHSQNVHPDGWLIWPVDHPMVNPETISILIKEFSSKTNSIIVPRCNNRNGHPIIIPGFMTIPDQPDPNGLKGVLMKSHCIIEHVDIDDEGILKNINTPEDVTYV